MKKVLIIGATDAMGKPLVDLLSRDNNYRVFATSRNHHESNVINWIQGNGKDFSFIQKLLKQNHFDCIVDFMIYSSEEFDNIYNFYLEHTDHYVFLSSARVYAPKDDVIDERSPRLIDVSNDVEFLSGKDYSLEKAREEDMLLKSKHNNYTIVRPSLTYYFDRFQFGLFEEHEFMPMVLSGHSLLLPSDIRDVKVTMTFGVDVAFMISKIILNNKTYGEILNVVNPNTTTWQEVLEIYKKEIESKTKQAINVKYVNNGLFIAQKLNKINQYKYARSISRSFSNKKTEDLIGSIQYTSIQNGLSKCISNYINKYDNKKISDYTWVPRFLKGVDGRSDKIAKNAVKSYEYDVI